MKKLLLFITAIFICGAAIAQTETTKWYIEGELYDTTSCESGNDITTPQVPERFGYTFSGWEPAVYDMSTLDKTKKGTSFSTYSNQKWSTNFDYGTVYGNSICSPTSDNPIEQAEGFDTESGGKYCYCRITEFIPGGDTKIYSPKYSNWLLLTSFGNFENCASNCTKYCGICFRDNDYSIRTRLLSYSY